MVSVPVSTHGIVVFMPGQAVFHTGGGGGEGDISPQVLCLPSQGVGKIVNYSILQLFMKCSASVFKNFWL